MDDWSATGTATGLAADRLGNVYAAGVVNVAQPDGSGRWHGQVRKSSNGGTNWTTVDDLAPSLTSCLVNAVITDPLGRVFVVGHVDYHWIVRRSDDAGASWTTSDEFAVELTFPSNRATSAAADSAGNIYVVGRGVQPDAPSNRGVWVVRKLAAPSPGPTLSATLAGSQLKLSWPATATGFDLQSATTLTNGGDWQDFLILPTEINGQKVVTITPTGPCGFFRLRRP